MNITEVLGIPVSDPVSWEGPSEPECSVSTTPEYRRKPEPRRLHWIWVALAVVATFAGGFGARTYLATPGVAERLPISNTIPDRDPASVGNFAELFTSLHLTGLASTADMSHLYVGTMPESVRGTWVNKSSAVAVELHGDDIWTVTVAADVLQIVEGAYESAGIQYFDVTVDSSGDHPIAISAPARVPGPGVARPSNAVPAFADTVPPDQLAAATAFLDAHLSGRGELARYVSTTAQIPPFDTPPYKSISIVTAAADSRGRVQVDLEATTGRGGLHRLQYVANMTFERGIWEVSSLVPVEQDG
jgi:hypothetical protein